MVTHPSTNAQTPLIRFVVDLLYSLSYDKSKSKAVQQIHNILTCQDVVDYNKSNHCGLSFDLLWTCSVAATDELFFYFTSDVTNVVSKCHVNVWA